jgi:hypothetical protein
MLVSWDIDGFGGLTLPLENNLIHPSDDLIDDICLAFNLDSIAISFSLGKLNCSGKFTSIVRSAGLDDNFAKCRT